MCVQRNPQAPVQAGKTELGSAQQGKPHHVTLAALLEHKESIYLVVGRHVGGVSLMKEQHGTEQVQQNIHYAIHNPQNVPPTIRRRFVSSVICLQLTHTTPVGFHEARSNVLGLNLLNLTHNVEENISSTLLSWVLTVAVVQLVEFGSWNQSISKIQPDYLLTPRQQ